MELESLPEGWEIRSLGEVTNIIKGKKPKSIVNQKMEGYVPYILIESFNKVYSKFTNELSCPQCNRDDIIMVMDGASSGLIAIGLEGVIGSTLAAIKPKGMIDSDYLFYWLKSKYKILNKRISGSTIPHVDKNLLKSLKFPIPPLEEQKKIVEILQFADYLKERRREAIKLIDKIVMSVFYDMFGDPATNPKGWEVKKLSEIADINPRNFIPENWNDEKEVGFIPMENIDGETGEIRQIGIKKLSRVRSGKTRFKEKDVLFAKITPCVENKKVALVRNLPSEVGFGSTEFHVIRAKEGITVPEFVLYLARTGYVREQAILSMTGTSGRKRVPASFLKNFDVPLPSLDLQQEFAEIVSKLEAKRKKMEEAEEKLEMLYQILLRQAFTGKLTEEWRMRRKEGLD